MQASEYEPLLPFGIIRSFREGVSDIIACYPLFGLKKKSNVEPQKFVVIKTTCLELYSFDENNKSINSLHTLQIPFIINSTCYHKLDAAHKIGKKTAGAEHKRLLLECGTPSEVLILLSNENKLYTCHYLDSTNTLSLHLKTGIELEVMSGIRRSKPIIMIHPNTLAVAIHLFENFLTIATLDWHSCELNSVSHSLYIPVTSVDKLCWLSLEVNDESDKLNRGTIVVLSKIEQDKRCLRVLNVNLLSHELEPSNWFLKTLIVPTEYFDVLPNPTVGAAFILISSSSIRYINAMLAYKMSLSKSTAPGIHKLIRKSDINISHDMPSIVSLIPEISDNTQNDECQWCIGILISRNKDSLSINNYEERIASLILKISDSDLSTAIIEFTSFVQSGPGVYWRSNYFGLVSTCDKVFNRKLCYLQVQNSFESQNCIKGINEVVSTSIDDTEAGGMSEQMPGVLMSDLHQWSSDIIIGTSVNKNYNEGYIQSFKKYPRSALTQMFDREDVFFSQVIDLINSENEKSVNSVQNQGSSISRVYPLIPGYYLIYITSDDDAYDYYQSGGGVVVHVNPLKDCTELVANCIPLLPGVYPASITITRDNLLWILWPNLELTVVDSNFETVISTVSNIICVGLYNDHSKVAAVTNNNEILVISKGSLSKSKWSSFTIENNLEYPLITSALVAYDDLIFVADHAGYLISLQINKDSQDAIIKSRRLITSSDDPTVIITFFNDRLFLITKKLGRILEIRINKMGDMSLSELKKIGSNPIYDRFSGVLYGSKGFFSLNDASIFEWIQGGDMKILFTSHGNSWKSCNKYGNWFSITDTGVNKDAIRIVSTVSGTFTPEKLLVIKHNNNNNNEYKLLVLLSHCASESQQSVSASSNSIAIFSVDSNGALKEEARMPTCIGDDVIDMILLPIFDELNPQLLKEELIVILSRTSKTGRVHTYRCKISEEKTISLELVGQWMAHTPLECILAVPWSMKDRKSAAVSLNHILVGGSNVVHLLRFIQIPDDTTVSLESKNKPLLYNILLLQKFYCHVQVVAMDGTSSNSIFMGDLLRSVGAFKVYPPNESAPTSSSTTARLVRGEDINIIEHHNRTGAAFLVGEAQLEEKARDCVPFQVLSLAAMSESIIVAADIHNHLVLQFLPQEGRLDHQKLLPDAINSDILTSIVTSGGITHKCCFTVLKKIEVVMSDESVPYDRTSMLWGDSNGGIGDLRFFRGGGTIEFEVLSGLSVALDELEGYPLDKIESSRPMFKHALIDGDRLAKIKNLNLETKSRLCDLARAKLSNSGTLSEMAGLHLGTADSLTSFLSMMLT